MTPAGGNGANTAVQDSALLGRLIAEAWARGDTGEGSDGWTGVTAAYEKEMRVYASKAVKESYGQAASQFDVQLNLQTTPTINEYIAPN
jgi:2-polyprenyl-6-methoxyphenol hydroxylase-like FAD-dependent oxidoreductase